MGCARGRSAPLLNPLRRALLCCAGGGLCPGLNDVVQNIVYTLVGVGAAAPAVGQAQLESLANHATQPSRTGAHPVSPPLLSPWQDDYGVPEDQIFGIRYGLRGFLDRHAKPVQLSRATVDGIQLKGGTVLVRAAYGGTVCAADAAGLLVGPCELIKACPLAQDCISALPMLPFPLWCAGHITRQCQDAGHRGAAAPVGHQPPVRMLCRLLCCPVLPCCCPAAVRFPLLFVPAALHRGSSHAHISAICPPLPCAAT